MTDADIVTKLNALTDKELLGVFNAALVKRQRPPTEEAAARAAGESE